MSPELEKVVVFRPLEPGDVNFILDSWLKSYRDSDWAGVVPNHLYYQTMHESVEGLLARGAKIEVACARHDSTKILGWICSEIVKGGWCMHAVYVKDPYRRLGLAKELITRNETQGRRFYTFRTKCSGYFAGLEYAPEIARRK